MNKIYIVAILIIALGGVYYYGTTKSEIEYRQVKETVILDNLVSKVNELKGGLMSELKACESNGLKESDGLITFDPHPTNKKVQKASIGLYQFKVSTVQFYYKELYGKDITGLEAVKIALSEEKSSELASDIVFKKQALNNWYNCTKAHGLQGKLDIINLLLK